MPDTWFNVKKIISLIVFVVVFSLMGLATGQPLMILAYAGFFCAVIFVIYLTLRKKQRHSEVSDTKIHLIRKIIGGIMLLLALLLPEIVIARTNLINLPELNAGIIAMIFGINILFIGLMLFAARLINTSGNKPVMSFLGYAIIIIVAAVPGLIMSGIERSTTGIGSVYYLALAVLILAWNGSTPFLTKE